ncbi:hypothetical protein GGS21DRAFT_13662 [Xylaria nigripes]|nr:hypothetical protein GGS21DRAFT_13662 [Xylaria nigripes]
MGPVSSRFSALMRSFEVLKRSDQLSARHLFTADGFCGEPALRRGVINKRVAVKQIQVNDGYCYAADTWQADGRDAPETVVPSCRTPDSRVPHPYLPAQPMRSQCRKACVELYVPDGASMTPWDVDPSDTMSAVKGSPIAENMAYYTLLEYLDSPNTVVHIPDHRRNHTCHQTTRKRLPLVFGRASKTVSKRGKSIVRIAIPPEVRGEP